MESSPSSNRSVGAIEALIQLFDDIGQYRLVVVLALILMAYLSGRYGGQVYAFLRGDEPIGEEAKKLERKRLNEHIKHFGSFCNAVGTATIAAAFIVPYIQNNTPKEPFVAIQWLLTGVVMHLLGHLAIRIIRSEG